MDEILTKMDSFDANEMPITSEDACCFSPVDRRDDEQQSASLRTSGIFAPRKRCSSAMEDEVHYVGIECFDEDISFVLPSAEEIHDMNERPWIRPRPTALFESLPSKRPRLCSMDSTHGHDDEQNIGSTTELEPLQLFEEDSLKSDSDNFELPRFSILQKENNDPNTRQETSPQDAVYRPTPLRPEMISSS